MLPVMHLYGSSGLAPPAPVVAPPEADELTAIGPGPEVVSPVDVASVLAGWTEAGKSAVLDQLQHVTPRAFPLSGTDLLACGLKAGPSLGSELARLEGLWIDSGFSLDRAALLELVEK